MPYSFPFFPDVGNQAFGNDNAKIQLVLAALQGKGGRLVFQVHNGAKKKILYLSLSSLHPRLKSIIHNKAVQKRTYKSNQHIQPRDELYRFLNDYKELDFDSQSGFCRYLQAKTNQERNEIAQGANADFERAWRSENDEDRPLGGNFYNHALPKYNETMQTHKGHKLFTVEEVEGKEDGRLTTHNILFYHDPNGPNGSLLSPAVQVVPAVLWLMLYLDGNGEWTKLTVLKQQFGHDFRSDSTFFGMFFRQGKWDSDGEQVWVRAYLTTAPETTDEQRERVRADDYTGNMENTVVLQQALLYYLVYRNRPMRFVEHGEAAISSPVSSIGSASPKHEPRRLLDDDSSSQEAGSVGGDGDAENDDESDCDDGYDESDCSDELPFAVDNNTTNRQNVQEDSGSYDSDELRAATTLLKVGQQA